MLQRRDLHCLAIPLVNKANQVCFHRSRFVGRECLHANVAPVGIPNITFKKRVKKLILILALLFSVSAYAQSPTETISVTVKWDENPDTALFVAEDQNGNPVVLQYRVYIATNVTGPYTVIGETAGLSLTMPALPKANHFFYVTAFFLGLESNPSQILSLPMGPVQGTKLIIQVP